MNQLKIIVLLLGLAIVAWLIWPKDGDAAEQPIICHIGGTMTPVFEKLEELYEKETGKQVEIRTAGSGELLATIDMQKEGDLYVSHDPFMDRVMWKGLGVNAWRVAEIYPVIIVQKGNPLHIKSLQDLKRPDVKLYLTDYKYSTLGNILPVIFEKAGIDLEELKKKKKIETHRSGSHVANLLIMKAADAAIVWQAVAHLRKKDVDVVPIDKCLPVPGVDAVTSATGRAYFVAPVKVTVTSLVTSKRQKDAEDFVRFIISDQGKEVFREYGFKVGPEAGRQEYTNGIKVD